MTQNRNRVIFVAVLLAGGALYALLVHLPQNRRLNDVHDQTARIASQCEQDAAKARAIPTINADVEQMKREFKDFDQRLPEQTELAEFLREISGAGEAQRLTNQVIKPGNPSVGALYNRLPIIMDFNCSFGDLVGFLERMKAMTRLTRVERIQISPLASSTEDLEVRMQVNIYFTKS